MKLKLKIVFKTVVCLVCCLGCNSYGQTVVPNKDMDAYLLIGQSNMAGRGTLDAQSRLASEAVLMLDKTNNWVVAKQSGAF